MREKRILPRSDHTAQLYNNDSLSYPEQYATQGQIPYILPFLCGVLLFSHNNSTITQ